MKNNDLLYGKEAKATFTQIVNCTAMAMLLQPKIDGKGMDLEDLTAYNARIAQYNDGIIDLARRLTDLLKEEETDD